MRAGPRHTLWWQLTPVQRALLKRVARDGSIDRLMPWEGLTVRSLVARSLLKRRSRESEGTAVWRLTPRGREVLLQGTEEPRAEPTATRDSLTRPGSPR